MRIRRLIPALSVCLAAGASTSTAIAQPKGDPKKAPAAPAKAPAPAPTPAPTPTPAPGPGTGTGAGGEPVQMSEDPPPSDIEGREENPDAPKIPGEPGPSIVAPAKPKRTGYPIEEAMRPITLPRNMSEVGLGPHAQLSPYRGADALRARYGITDKVQIGLTYMIAGIHDDPLTASSDKIGVHFGKAVGLDLTVMLKSFVGVRLGVPVYIDPLAVAVTLGAPMKFQFADGKYAIGMLDDLLSIRIKRFVPSFYQEYDNALAAAGTDPVMGNQTIQSRGDIRFTAYGVMQYRPKVAFVGRLGVVVRDFSTTQTSASTSSGLQSLIRAGVQYTPRKFIDLGFSIGFDDMSRGGSFGPAGLIAFRI